MKVEISITGKGVKYTTSKLNELTYNRLYECSVFPEFCEDLDFGKISKSNLIDGSEVSGILLDTDNITIGVRLDGVDYPLNGVEQMHLTEQIEWLDAPDNEDYNMITQKEYAGYKTIYSFETDNFDLDNIELGTLDYYNNDVIQYLKYDNELIYNNLSFISSPDISFFISNGNLPCRI